METKIDLTKLRPFDLEAAKAGKPVCTRDGRPARIICFDRETEYYPIVALVRSNYDSNEENVEKYTLDGKFRSWGSERELDLMMPLEKKEGWVNVYRSELGETHLGVPRKTEEEAREAINESCAYITTTKIEWYEQDI